MEQKQKLSDIAGKVTPLEEDQQGKLTGGFTAFGGGEGGGEEPVGGSNVNNVTGCACNVNSSKSCSCS